MTYNKPMIEEWKAVVSIEDTNEKPGVQRTDGPSFVGTINAYQADE